MKNRRLFSFVTAVIMIFSLCTFLPVKISVPFEASAAYENTYVNTGNQADDIVGVAKTQVGYTEIGNNYTKYNEWFGSLSGYGKNYAWCQTFVAWCANQAGIPTSMIPRVSGTVSGMDFFKKNGTWNGAGYTPSKGDIIYFRSGSSNSGYHVGIVSDVANGTIYTIEGNSSDKVSTHSYSVSSSKIAGYGCPNYVVPDPKQPTNVTLSQSQVWYDIKDTVTLYASSDNATSYWISVLKDGVSVINTQISGELSFAASDYGYGDYHAWVTAVNSSGATDSNHVDFSVVGAATYTNVYTSQNFYTLDDVVSISVDTICAKGQVIGIDKIGTGRMITENCDSTYTISASQLGVGEYSAYFTVYNGSGSVDTERVSFTIYVPQQGYTMSESEGAGKTIPDGDYYIYSFINSDYYLDIEGAEVPALSGTNVSMYKILTNFFPDEQDVWTLSYLDNGFYKIKQKGTNMCLSLEDNSLLRGTNVQLCEDNNSILQQWSVIKTDNGYKIKSRCSAYNMDVQGGAFEYGTNVHVWEANDTSSQRFTFVPYGKSIGETLKSGTYTILSAASSEYCMNVDKSISQNQYTPETNINLEETYKSNDTFIVEYLGNGYYSICESKTGYALDLWNETPSNYLNTDLNIQLGSNHNGRNQKWIIKDSGDGYYYIISALSGYYMNINDEVCKSLQNISQSPYDESEYLKWKFVTPEIITGDCNNDGKFNISDVVILQKWLLSVPDAKLDNWESADMNDDGVIDIFDMVLMRQALIKK